MFFNLLTLYIYCKYKKIVYTCVPCEQNKLTAQIDSSYTLRQFILIKENRVFIRILLLWAKRCNFECAKQTKELGSNTFFPPTLITITGFVSLKKNKKNFRITHKLKGLTYFRGNMWRVSLITLPWLRHN